MRHFAAYFLAVLGRSEVPSSKDIKKILDSLGIQADDERLDKVISELKGKDVHGVISAGIAKLASGGAVAVSATSAAAEQKKEEKKEESEESDDEMGFD